MHADLFGAALANNADAPVARHMVELLLADGSQNLGQGLGSAAGSITLEAMVHFDNLQIEPRTKNLRRLAR